jgi:molybdopterin/thiamine biosynthesis adenylyltransferase
VTDIKCSIDTLANDITSKVEDYFTSKDMNFNRESFLKEAGTMIEYIAEIAHFTGTDILENLPSP